MVMNGRVMMVIRNPVDSSSNQLTQYPSFCRLATRKRPWNKGLLILPCLLITSLSPSCHSLSCPHGTRSSLPFLDRRNVLRTMTEEPLLVGLMGQVGRAISTSTISLMTMTTTTLFDSTAHAASDDDEEEEENRRTMPSSDPLLHHHHHHPHPFRYSPEWSGTRLSVRSLEEALMDPTFVLTVEQPPPFPPTTSPPPPSSSSISSSTTTNTIFIWPMARWPDPILRRPADDVEDVERWLGSSSSSTSSGLLRLLVDACDRLARTARYYGAVGLAAQQCGINARLIYLQEDDDGTHSQDGTVFINPRMVGRSPEQDVQVWTEQCLVLPPTWTATVLRDSWIDVEYYAIVSTAAVATPRTTTRTTTTTTTTTIPLQQQQQQEQLLTIRRRRRRLYGEASRCFQHEYDHDRGILLTDHVGFEEMESDVMRDLERTGHEERQAIAYARHLDDPLIV